jgi:MFS family permease
VQGYSPLGSGLRILPWTLAPMFIAPLAGALSDRIPAKTIIGVGLAMQAAALAWIGIVSEPDTPYSQLVAPFVIAGVGMAMFFAPVANIVLPRCGRRRRASPLAPTTPSASSAASSASRC